MFEDKFTEIEYEIPSAAPFIVAQKIGGRDPIREKFYDMRSLAPNNFEAWHDTKLFYRQGKFMESFMDDCDINAPLAMYSPSYQRLGHDQLRTFFTWRTQVREGKYHAVSLSYVFLHVYELLNCIGAQFPTHGLDKLMDLWSAYRGEFPVLDTYIPGWLRDYHIYYQLPHSFEEFVDKHSLHSFYATQNLFDLSIEHSLDTWGKLGNYDYKASKFYDGNEEAMRTGFYFLLKAFERHFQNQGKQLSDMLFLRTDPIKWLPFEGAVFYPWLKQPDRVVKMSETEVYTCTNDYWIADRLTPYQHNYAVAAKLITQTEYCLRKAKKFKGIFNFLKNKKYFHQVHSQLTLSSWVGNNIFYENAITEALAYMQRVVVTVDTQNLHRIRQEAEVTQEKLIVEDAVTVVAPPPVAPAVPATTTQLDTPWESFKAVLTPTELDAIKILVTNPSQIKEFATMQGLMLEILVDGINEKAMDTVFDNIISDEMEVYGDYVNEVREW